MPTVPCPNPTNCLDAESPVANLSSEGPDEAKCFRYSFTETSSTVCEYPLTLCEAFSEIGLDVGILCDPPDGPPGGPNPSPPVIYSSAAQACEVDCGDGTSETYTVVAGTFVALSQAEADASAFAFACELAALLCDGPLPALFTNTAQSCTVNCPDQTTFTYTVPAGFFTALSQAEADANAYVFACAVAALLCSGLPPTGASTGAGTEPEVPSQPLYSNYAQTCTSACANGSTFTYTAEGGLYQAESRDAANAIAYSYACAQANARRFCIDDLPDVVCVGEFLFDSVTTDGSPGPLTYSLVSGSLPPGLFLASTGFLSGIPTTPGTSSFTIRATSGTGYSDRAFTMAAIEITPDILSNGVVGTPYAEALTDAGTTGIVTWSIDSGSLPTGLSLNPNTGVISGTPTTGGTYNFVVRVTDSLGACDLALSIGVTDLTPAAWWSMEVAGPLPDVTGNGNTLTQTAGAGVCTAAAGKVALALTQQFAGPTFAQYTTGYVASLAIPGGLDINLVGWSYIGTPGVGTAMQQFFTLNASTWAGGLRLDLRANGTFDIFDLSTFANLLTGAITMDAWFFWHLKIDGATGIVSLAFNNGAPMVGAPAFAAPASPDGFLSVQCSDGAAGPYFGQVDEVALFLNALSAANLTNLYNGGAGRTFP